MGWMKNLINTWIMLDTRVKKSACGEKQERGIMHIKRNFFKKYTMRSQIFYKAEWVLFTLETFFICSVFSLSNDALSNTILMLSEKFIMQSRKVHYRNDYCSSGKPPLLCCLCPWIDLHSRNSVCQKLNNILINCIMRWHMYLLTGRWQVIQNI